MYSFDGMRVLVVGGSSGIGLGTAKVAFEAGADVTIAGRSEERLAGAAKAIGGNVTTAVLDATDDAAVTDYFAGSGAWNHVAVTIGKGGRGLIQDLDMATAYAAMDAKFWPYFRIARAAEIVTGGSLTFVRYRRAPSIRRCGISCLRTPAKLITSVSKRPCRPSVWASPKM